MVLLILLVHSVIHVTSQGWWDDNGHHDYISREAKDGWPNDPPVFKSFAMDDNQPEPVPEEEEKYSIEKLKREVMTIEFNLWRYILNISYFDDKRHRMIVSDQFNIEKPLDFLIATNDLLESKYGTRFSTPMEGEQEHFDEGMALFKLFESDLLEMIKQWKKISSFKDVYASTGIMYDGGLHERYEAIFLAQDRKALEGIVERMKIVRDRFTAQSEADVDVQMESFDLPSDADTLRNPTVYNTSVNVTQELKEIEKFVCRLFGYIFNVKPSLHRISFVTLSAIHPKPENAGAIVFIRRALEDLYGDLVVDRNLLREGSFSDRHHDIVLDRLFKTAEEIHTFWWNQVFMLSHKQIDLDWTYVEYKDMVRARVLFSSADQIEQMEKRLEEVKALTFANTTSTTFEAEFV